MKQKQHGHWEKSTLLTVITYYFILVYKDGTLSCESQIPVTDADRLEPSGDYNNESGGNSHV